MLSFTPDIMRLWSTLVLILVMLASSASGWTWLRQLFSSWLRPSRRFITPYDNRFNDQDRPKGPPYVKNEPGPLSFNLGRLRFRQSVYDLPRNQGPVRFKPGPLSFRIGPIRFNQIPSYSFRVEECCYDPLTNCYDLFFCNRL